MLVLSALSLLLLAVLGAVLVQRFRATRNTGYLVLIVPLALWPVLSAPLNWLFDRQADRLVDGEPLVWPLSLFGDMSVGRLFATLHYTTSLLRLALIVLGFLWLAHRESAVAAQAVPAPATAVD